jgi:hypothetical protein
MDVKLILLIFALLLGIVIRILVSRQTPSQAVSKKPRHLVSIPTVLKSEEIFPVIRAFASQADMATAEVSPAEGRIILRQEDQILHGGFWMPIYVSTHSSGITVVEVGMQALTPLGAIPDYLLKKKAQQLEILLNAGASK